MRNIDPQPPAVTGLSHAARYKTWTGRLGRNDLALNALKELFYVSLLRVVAVPRPTASVS
jgi:hypothetical protein